MTLVGPADTVHVRYPYTTATDTPDKVDWTTRPRVKESSAYPRRGA